jgi:hypothetical protein
MAKSFPRQEAIVWDFSRAKGTYADGIKSEDQDEEREGMRGGHFGFCTKEVTEDGNFIEELIGGPCVGVSVKLNGARNLRVI